MDNLFNFFMELDKLKSVYRRVYLTDSSRTENSAEHSWHLAMAIMSLHSELKLEIDLLKSIKMALVHDVCEIGPGDISVFDANRANKQKDEREYINQLVLSFPLLITTEISLLWEEYEAQETPESLWVKVVDRIIPFIMNITTQGKSWIEQGIAKSQVLKINIPVKDEAPEIYQWMLIKIDMAVEQGWLKDC